MTAAEHKVGFKHTKVTPYLTLMGKLWGVFCVHFGENWPSYNGTAPYMYDIYIYIGLLFQVCIWTQEIPVMYPVSKHFYLQNSLAPTPSKISNHYQVACAKPMRDDIAL